MEFLMSLLIGFSLSAVSGFRVFVPLLVLSIASIAGWLELAPSFSWLGTYPALAALLVATVIELAAYFIPYVDNLLGMAATPVSIMAGAMITASVLIELDPLLAWALAIMVGGGAALGGSALSNTVHAGSTAATGGTANPAVSMVESAGSIFFALLAVLLPVVTFLIIAFLIYYGLKIVRRLSRNRIAS